MRTRVETCGIMSFADRPRDVAEDDLVGVEHERERALVAHDEPTVASAAHLERHALIDRGRAFEGETHVDALRLAGPQLAAHRRERDRATMRAPRQVQQPLLRLVAVIRQRDRVVVQLADVAQRARQHAKVEHAFRNRLRARARARAIGRSGT